MDLWVLVVGLAMIAVTAVVAGRRIIYLFRLITSGQPAPDRVEGVTKRLVLAGKTQLVEVFGQRKLLKWTVPGVAHFMVFWAFLILGTVYLEGFGILFSRNPEWAIPIIGHWDIIGFAQDTIALLCLVGLAMFASIRLRENPDKLGRKSRFKGSHTGGAWLVLFMIVNVIWTLFFFRGAAAAAGSFPYGWGAYASHTVGKAFEGFSHETLEVLEGVGLLLHLGVMLVFLIDVVHSKHLHIFVAPLNVLFSRRPKALGAAKPLMSDGKPITLDDVDDLDEDSKLGIGSIQDFSWKGMLDFASCTECGRCQSQCPAWNTEKPLSPKMLIMNLRDHAFTAGPAILAGEGGSSNGTDAAAVAELERPLVGETEGEAWDPTGGGVIDPDVLWSCVTCGACVEQCPVDIEHVDHIVDMRRYQVLVESNFPAELNQLFKGMENKGNPWNLSASARMEWAKGLPFDVKVVGEDVESLDEVEWLFWVGCAGAYEDRAKKTTRAVAELLDMAGVSFAVLGNGETCTGDSARRAGNEFLFQGLAQQNVETFNEYKVKKVVSTCAHCFNTLKNEYKEFGIELEVVHHTQLLNRLVRDGLLTPVSDGAGAHRRSITYHDPCYIGRHNGVYSPPRELLEILPGAEFNEMERNSERSFCCGAGGARMWMEETIGQRINNTRTAEAIGTGADQIAVGCPFCRVMLDDGLTAAKADGAARQEVEVLDVAQMLLASVKGEQATKLKPGEGELVGAGAPAAKGTASASAGVAADEASAGASAAASGSSLFADSSPEESEAPAAPSAKKSDDVGLSLFDDPKIEETQPPSSAGSSLFDTPSEGAPPVPAQDKPSTTGGSSLFDTPAPAEPEAPAAPAEEAEPAVEESAGKPSSGGSLFDVQPAEPEVPAAPAEAKTSESAPEAAQAVEPEATEPAAASGSPAPSSEPASSISEGGSLFDIQASEPAAASSEPAPEAAPAEPEDTTEPDAEEPEVEEPAETPAATEEPEAEPADEAPEEEPAAQPTESPEAQQSSGEKHAPRTDADIGGAGSLFDL